MTNSSTASKFNLPTHTISVEELRRSMPKPKRLRKAFLLPAPSADLMAELQGLLRQLHPDDRHPDRPWISVLIIINYETAGHPDGFALADAWSRRGKAYKGSAGVRKYWNNIKSCPKNPLTIRTLRWMVDQRHGSTNTNAAIDNKEN